MSTHDDQVDNPALDQILNDILGQQKIDALEQSGRLKPLKEVCSIACVSSISTHDSFVDYCSLINIESAEA